MDSARPIQTDSIDWIELVLCMSCNCRCQVCPSAQSGPSSEMTAAQITRWLEVGRRRGAHGVWFGGGEPTLHPHLVAAVKTAKRLGYQRLRLQTNGMRLAYAAYCRTLIEAGVGEISVPLLGADAEQHDEMAQRPQAFELMQQGICNALEGGVRVEGDILITTHSIGSLVEIVERFATAGLSAFTFWFVSLHGLSEERFARFVPTLPDVIPALTAALERAAALGVSATTLHTPPCVLPPEHRDRYAPATDWRLLVVTPSDDSFPVEASPFEGGVYLDSCAECSWRQGCLGLRADYLRLHGAPWTHPTPQRP